MALMLLLLLAGARAADPAPENLTDTDEAEFRQGGIAQQLMAASSYPAGLYSASNAYQQYAAGTGAGTGAGGYMNMIRNLYRPPSLGLTDKVKHWVKSFMNRRQYVKPYYGAPGLQYSADEFGGSSGKPMLMSGGGYKAISIPLRQLQKYYKPYYGGEGGFPQQSPAAASSSVLSYSPSGAGNGGLYASETAAAGHFAGGNSGGLFGGGGSSSGGLFGSGSSTGGLFGAGAGSSSGGLFGSGSDASSLFAGSPSSGLFSGSQGGIYSSGGNLFSPSGDGSSSGLFSASGLQGLYGSGGASSGGLYLPSGAGSSAGGSSGYSLDAGSSFGSDGGSSSYLGGGGDYGSRTAAASSLLSSLGAAGGASQYGDLYASGASPAATVYNPSSGGHQGRGYGGSSGGSKKQQQQQQQSYGASSSALYVPSSSDSMRSPESYPMKSAQEAPQLNSFNVDSSRNSPAEASYSVSFQPAQGKSYSAPYENAGFQPVSFGAEDGFKGKSS